MELLARFQSSGDWNTNELGCYALTTARSWNTNGIMLWAWMLRSGCALGTKYILSISVLVTALEHGQHFRHGCMLRTQGGRAKVLSKPTAEYVPWI